MASNEMIIKTKSMLHNLVFTHWLKEELFSAKWWGLVVFTVISYVVFFLILDKRRFTEITLFGSLLSLGTVFADTIGTNFVWWSYIVRIFPLIPSFFEYAFTTIPVYYMLTYQYTSTWGSFMIWNIVVAGVVSFGFFNILIAFSIITTRCPLWVNFLELILTSSLTRAVVLGMLAIEKQNKN